MFKFENFRVRKLVSINALNFYITLCMAFLAIISMQSETNALKVSIIKTADPIKEKVFFCYYRLAKGISGILSYAKEGVRLWFRTKRPAYRQLCFKLVAQIDKRIVLPKSGSGGAYFGASRHPTVTLFLSKNWQIGTLRRFIYPETTFCGNSSNNKLRYVDLH